jgi:hypothetical protein
MPHLRRPKRAQDTVVSHLLVSSPAQGVTKSSRHEKQYIPALFFSHPAGTHSVLDTAPHPLHDISLIVPKFATLILILA